MDYVKDLFKYPADPKKALFEEIKKAIIDIANDRYDGQGEPMFDNRPVTLGVATKLASMILIDKVRPIVLSAAPGQGKTYMYLLCASYLKTNKNMSVLIVVHNEICKVQLVRIVNVFF